MASEFDTKVAQLAHQYKGLAAEILREVIRIPADHVAQDPSCGLSNHEYPRLLYLKNKIVACGAVERPEDVDFDEMGNLVWTVEDRADGIPEDQKVVVYLDGHTDTVNALRAAWQERLGTGVDCYNGLTDPSKVDIAALHRELGFVPPTEAWKEHVLFGRGSADQLAGVVSQVVACKIMLELKALGALKGIIIRSYGTVAEEDNDGGAPMFVMKKVLSGKNVPAKLFPDAVIFTEGTGDSRINGGINGALGIYRGQRGRMQIEVDVLGKSCHGSMPWEGRNPLEAASKIISEAADRYEKRIGFLDDKFLGHGTRTASWSTIKTPSDCAVPERFTFRFDRRLTIGETPEAALADIEGLESVAAARKNGIQVTVSAPLYEDKTWKGYQGGNKQIYNCWVTPEEHPAIKAAVDSYHGVVTPHAHQEGEVQVPVEPRVSRWIFSTDGVGFVTPSKNEEIAVPKQKRWIDNGQFKHPAMFGIGAGFEQNTHKIGENVDLRELVHAIAFIAKFPSTLRASLAN